MKTLALLTVLVFLNKNVKSQNIREFIFPDGIKKSSLNFTNSDGSKDESSIMALEYLITPNAATVFESNYLANHVASRKKEEFLITDTAIYLVNINTRNILSYNQENFMGYNNCFLKLPAKGKSIVWSFRETKNTSYKCTAALTMINVSNIQYPAIKVDKIPFENGQYLERFKSSVYYVKGKGLYKEEPTTGKKAIYILSSVDFEDSKNVMNEPVLDSSAQIFEGEYDFKAAVDMWTESGRIDTLLNNEIYFKVSGDYFMEFKNGVLLSKKQLKIEDQNGNIELTDGTIVSFVHSKSERIAGTTIYPNSAIMFKKRTKGKNGDKASLEITRWYRGIYSDL
ncbi:MAG: hypothetical protein QM764_04655 [Chitinophagaceae bacterium]